MDLHMPVMDGFEASVMIRAMRGDQQWPRVFAVSADVFAASEQGEHRGAFDGALTKPFRASELAELLATVPPRS